MRERERERERERDNAPSVRILSLSNTFKEANVFSQYKVQLQAVKEAFPIVLALPLGITSERQLDEE